MKKKHEIQIPEGMRVHRELWPTENNDKVVIEFEPIKTPLPKTWEDFTEITNKSIYLDDYTMVTVYGKYKDAFVALNQLIELRDYYNDGWVPDWRGGNSKHCIQFYEGQIDCGIVYSTNNVLAFKASHLRDEFLKNFYDLIEQAKPLL